MKKFLFLIALLTLMGGVNSYATKLYATYGTPAGNGSFNSETGEYTWDNSSNNLMDLFTFGSGELANYVSLYFSTSNYVTDCPYRVCFMNGSTAVATIWFYSGGDKDLVFSKRSETKDLDLSQITSIKFGGASGSGSITITKKPYLEKPTTLDFDAFGKGSISKSDLTATGGLTYNSSTGVLTSDGTVGTMVLEFATPVDLSKLIYYNVVRSGSDDAISRLKFYDEDNSEINTWNSIRLGNLWQATGIDDNATNAFLNHKPVKKMVWESDANDSNEGKTLTITSVDFTLKTISCEKAGETVLKSLPWNKKDGSGTETPAWNMNVSTDTYYGNYSSDPTHYADLTGYEELRIYRDNNDGFRAFFINAAGGGSNTINHDNSTWNAEGKYWSIDLSKIEKWDSKVALKSIKSASSGLNNIVKNIVVYNTPAANVPQYTLTGSGLQLAETIAALADATVTCIDATGVTGITTNSEAGRTLLTSANHNCLFLGTTGNGGLANTKNVVTSGTCANLVLTDGNYAFKAPADFTATSASYDRSFTAGTRSTVCLPFALTAAEAEAAGTFYKLSGTNAEGTELTFTDVTSSGTTAYKPYIFEAKEDGTPFSTYSNKAIAATPATFTGATVEGYTLTGVLAGSTDVAADNEGKTVYGWSGNDGKEGTFVKVGTGVAINPFRAYVVYDGDASLARVAARFVGGSVTGINEVSETQNVLNPDRKYIENGKIVIVKNGVKYNAAGQQVK